MPTTAPAADDTDQSVPTGDPTTFYAYAFLNDLNSNAAMMQAWKACLAAAKKSNDSVDAKVKYVDNFLADNGYDTTGKAVLTLIKAPWWETYLKAKQPSPASDRFVQDLLAAPDLATDWSKAAGTATTDDTSSLTTFLQGRGYDCTPQQVSASFDKMRRHNMNYWTGIYGKTTLTPASGGTSQPGPAVIMYGNTDVTLGPDHVSGFSFQNGVLTWSDKGGDPLTANTSKGSITFSHATEPRRSDQYVGNLFSGTLELASAAMGLSAGTYSFYGQIGDPPDNRPGHVTSPPSVNKEPVHDLHYYLQQILFYGGLAMMAYFVGQATGINDVIAEKFKSVKEKISDAADDLKEKWQSAREGADPPADADFSESTGSSLIKEEGLPEEEEVKALDEQAESEAADDQAAQQAVSSEGEPAENLDEVVEP